MTGFQPIQPARLRWQGAAPYSRQYNDIFFDRDDALAEARYVFLAGNELPQRWSGRRQFTVGETGFGTGLNFLATVQAWCDTAAADARLHYVAVEKHPLTVDDLAKALSPWLELEAWAKALLGAYPQPVYGFHRLMLLDGRVSLTLLFGDAQEMLTQLHAGVDAWYLDGFAPSRNSSMWSAGVFRQLARLSVSGTSFATFTAAGAVRRGLAEAGFGVTKRPGFGRKREMLHGRFQGEACTILDQPWFALVRPAQPSQRYAIVVGAGLAGCFAAHALAQRGWRVDVIDRHDGFAREASGNPAGVVLPRMTADMNDEGRFYLAAFLYASRYLERLSEAGTDVGWRRSGVLQLAGAGGLADKLAPLALPDAVMTSLGESDARQVSGIAVRGGGLHYSLGGWVSPPRLCAYLLQCFSDRVNFLSARHAIDLTMRDDLWHVSDGRDVIGVAPVVILAGGTATADHVNALFSLQAVRGQLTYAAATPASRRLLLPVCYDGYITPELSGQHCVGATFSREHVGREICADDDRLNMAALSRNVEGLALTNIVGGRVSFRATTLDRLPICGPVPDVVFYKKNYIELRHGPRARHFPDAVYRPGLFVTSGHGARGLVSCPVSGELIAAMLNDEPLPLPINMISSLHPGRFVVRDIKRAGRSQDRNKT